MKLTNMETINQKQVKVIVDRLLNIIEEENPYSILHKRVSFDVVIKIFDGLTNSISNGQLWSKKRRSDLYIVLTAVFIEQLVRMAKNEDIVSVNPREVAREILKILDSSIYKLRTSAIELTSAEITSAISIFWDKSKTQDEIRRIVASITLLLEQVLIAIQIRESYSEKKREETRDVLIKNSKEIIQQLEKQVEGNNIKIQNLRYENEQLKSMLECALKK